MSTHCWDLPVWSSLKEAAAKAKTVHLRDSLKVRILSLCVLSHD